ncbi:hypothetical protein QFC24_000266 [Naganishia onofrii]|uniref:Uncharacterized protein n=1 Tax=Naganishia onofrii TaxID=1851511 RepID=A0ACC2XX26_9TREE|nr:hypothetical protein QFC24_000266 [Naganishia onofrii]
MSRPTLLELAQHPSAMEKLTVMRSGGPFDRSTGIDCLAVDRFLSVQTQQQHQPASSSSRTGGGAGGDQRERSSRSFAPSPQVTSHKTSLLTSGEEDGRGVARLQANVPRSTRSSTTTNIAPFDNEHESTRLRDATVARPCLANSWSGASTSTVTAPFDADYGSTRLLCSPSSKSVSSRGAISVHKVGVDLDEDDDDDDDDARTDMADVVAKENWPASPRASSAGEAEGYRTTPTPFSRMNTRSVTEVLYEFDARAILRKYGKPLCAKYHLNNGNCHCETLDKAIHDDIILKGSASKQLALWASDRVCPEGANCPEGLNRTCCFWRHEMRSSGGSVDSATDESDEWIAVDKKGKPIVSKPHIAVPHVWQPSKSCIEAGKLARADFNPLMTIIRQFTRDRHMPKHERGLIGTELKRAYGHDIYRRLGLAGFKEYTSRAEKAGLVRMGYQGPSAGWIAAA